MGTPTYVPQNDPHDALIILNIYKWVKKYPRKNLPISSGCHQPRSDPEVRSGVKKFSVFFKHFLILHKILSILSIDTLGEKKYTPSKKIFGAFGADPFPQNRFENFGGIWRGGGLEFEQAAPLDCNHSKAHNFEEECGARGTP